MQFRTQSSVASLHTIDIVSAAVACVGFLCITIDSSFDVQILAVVVDERLAIIPLVVPYAGLAVMSLVVHVQYIPFLLKLFYSQ